LPCRVFARRDAFYEWRGFSLIFFGKELHLKEKVLEIAGILETEKPYRDPMHMDTLDGAEKTWTKAKEEIISDF